MIDKLHIKNFLAFPELEVPELKQINLVAGKNGVGKTALLEALALYARRSSAVISDIIIDRKLGPHDDITTPRKILNRKVVEDSQDIMINNLSLELDSNSTMFTEIENLNTEDLERLSTGQELLLQKKHNVLFLKAVHKDKLVLSLWEEVKLTPLEDDVLEIVKGAIDENIIRFDLKGEDMFVRLSDSFNPVNLYSLGSGVRRVLTLALSLTKLRNGGVLLIDEIETHLHFSVIRKLWKIIFEYAVKWNIQVVATTHSMDAIQQFWYEAAENNGYQNVSQVLRLQINRDGKHEVIQFPFERLDRVMEMEMEIR